MKKELREWAEKYVPKFNELAQKYNTSYYTQSPLDKVETSPELMVIGINPAGTFGGGAEVKDADTFLKGNPCWSQRFTTEGRMAADWDKFLWNARFFLGFGERYAVNPIDDDTKTVWTNLTPFPSPKGSKDLKNEVLTMGIESTLELITVLKPKRIVFMGVGDFKALENCCQNMGHAIEHLRIVDSYSLEIGSLDNIPFVVIPHPCSSKWPLSNKFTSAFVLAHKLSAIEEKGKMRPLKEVAKVMKDELLAWKKIPIE
ncbi:MAG: hypothetical protein K2I87_05840 [Bacteroidales bacterium]|nr:hypothetical protein [Bacteroidales bacterium]